MAGGACRFLLDVEARLARLASHRWRAIVLVGLTSLAARALLLPVLPIPKPAIQDEFSYLLAADTFAHGRLANPTPAFPEHFETLQVLMHPTYASKYPPFSALAMALGQKLTGQPWVGVWLAGGVLCAAICWALQGWLSPAWALAGALVALLKIGIVSYWSESYWGGSWAAIGGALVVGALPRLLRGPAKSAAIALAAGLALLANTRPYEGVLLAVPCSVYLVHGLWRQHAGLARVARNIVLPTVLVLVPVAGWMTYYNYRVTGNALTMPYLEHERQYAIWSSLLWQPGPAPKPVYSNAFLEDFWVNADHNDKQNARDHLLKTHAQDLYRLAVFFLGLPLALCLMACARGLWRDRAGRAALLLLGFFYAGVAFNLRLFPHYAAPATVLVYIVAACGMRAVRHGWPGSRQERVYVGWAVPTVFAVVALTGVLTPQNRYLFGSIDYHVRAEHAAVDERLARIPGNHLVLVSYGPKHEIYQELVYNRADIDSARIIWARSLSPESDHLLMQHYGARQVWMLTEDGDLRLRNYTPGEERSTITAQAKSSLKRPF
jgi:hypothetical protein